MVWDVWKGQVGVKIGRCEYVFVLCGMSVCVCVCKYVGGCDLKANGFGYVSVCTHR